MIALHESAVRLVLTTDQPDELDALEEDFKVRPNGYFFAPSYQRYKLTKGREGWDGYLRQMKRLGHRQASILRGRRDEVIALCQAYGFEVDTTKLLPRPFENLTMADIPASGMIQSEFELDDYQRRCILGWLKACIGINQATVGAGKSAMFAAAAAMVKARYPTTRFLYLTPAERLVRQVTKWMREFLPDWDIGQFGGGHHGKDAADMVICTVAMLRHHRRALTQENWWRTFTCVLFDECHHATSESAEQLMMVIPAYFRFGASDSVHVNDDEKSGRMQGLLGSILNVVTAKPLMDVGRLAVPHIYVESMADHYGKFDDIGFRAAAGSSAWCLIGSDWVKGIYLGPVQAVDDNDQVKTRKKTVVSKGDDGEIRKEVVEEAITESGLHRIEIDGVEHHVESRWCLLKRVYDEAIVRFKPRMERIVQWVKYFSGQGHPTLVVATRTMHIYLLEAAIKAAVDPDLVDICFGSATPKQRDTIFERFKSGKGRVLITPLVKEGVSINEIKAGVIADYVGDIETANQIVGRFMRRKETENWAEIVWFAEDHHRTLRRGSRRILQQLEHLYKYPVHSPAPDVRQLLGAK